jgi:hypothetical protein
MTLQAVEEVLRWADLDTASKALELAHAQSRNSAAPGDQHARAAALATAAAETRGASAFTLTRSWAAETVEAQCKYANYMNRQVSELQHTSQLIVKYCAYSCVRICVCTLRVCVSSASGRLQAKFL